MSISQISTNTLNQMQNAAKFGSKIVPMNVMDVYEMLASTNTLTNASMRELKKLFRLNMADTCIVYNPDSDLPINLELYNVYIYKDMYNWLHEQYAKMFIDCNANKDEAITRLTNKFIDVMHMFTGIKMRYAGALFACKHMIYGYEYRRNCHFVNIPENNNFEFMYEIVCHA